MFEKPGIKTKQGLQVSGLYVLAGSLILSIFFPDMNQEQVLNSFQEVAAWWQQSGQGDVLGWVDDGLKLSAVTYIGNKLRKANAQEGQPTKGE